MTSITPHEFYQELENHDWFFRYSDDGNVYRRGEANWERIQDLAKTDPLFKLMFDDYVEWLWNHQVKTKPRVEDYVG